VKNTEALDKRIRDAFKRGTPIDEAFAKAAEFAQLRKELMDEVRKRMGKLGRQQRAKRSPRKG
jgi:hypothetical protein